MVDVIPWPIEVLRPRDLTPALRPTTRSAGVSLDGGEQIVDPGTRRWEITYDIGTEFDGEKLRAFEALVRRMRGRRNIAAVTFCDPYRYGSAVAPEQEPWSDGTWFTDGTGFVDDDASQPLYATGALAAGATTLTQDLTNPIRPGLRVGDFFSFDGFLYAVDEVDGATIVFSPELRRDVPAGTQIVTDPPVFYGRFSRDDEGVRTRELLRRGKPVTVTFVEAFDRVP